MSELDPTHVEAVAKAVSLYPGAWKVSTYGPGANIALRSIHASRDRARQLLTSPDPDVHEALLAALVRAGVLREVVGFSDDLLRVRRRYMTLWEDVDE